MKPLFHPKLVNGPFGDSALYIEFAFERRAVMFDIGEIQPLPPRKALKVTHVFVSHAHMDHFMGFDRLLRICVGRDRHLHVFGPQGMVAQVGHKLAAYTWNLVLNYATDFTVEATEVSGSGRGRRARFRCRNGFRPEDEGPVYFQDHVLLDEDLFRVRFAELDHKIPCLAFALEEKRHVNVWKNRLQELGLPTGPWLRDLKVAMARELADDVPIRVWWAHEGQVRERFLPLGFLKEHVLRLSPGQRIVYVVDALFSPANAQRIVDLAQNADVLFIEAAFLSADAQQAAEKYHLTAAQAGELARRAGVKRVVPGHFSARYVEQPESLYEELAKAFGGPVTADNGLGPGRVF